MCVEIIGWMASWEWGGGEGQIGDQKRDTEARRMRQDKSDDEQSEGRQTQKAG